MKGLESGADLHLHHTRVLNFHEEAPPQDAMDEVPDHVREGFRAPRPLDAKEMRQAAFSIIQKLPQGTLHTFKYVSFLYVFWIAVLSIDFPLENFHVHS